ncbi:MAG: HAD-IA family hydrolase [Anaerolineae bacterium]|nr:HAD-IA family hydrolase [Anaerolineae bacterium]
MTLLDGITHIIFDLDGLLVDTEPLWQAGESAILARYGTAWDPEIAKTHIGRRLDEAAAAMIAGYGLPLAAAVLEAEILEDVVARTAHELVAMPGADELVRRAYSAGYPLAIASSSPRYYIEAVVQQSGWAGLITHIASAYEAPQGKPAPDVYLDAIARLETTAARCIAFEDSPTGARAAQAAGLRTVAVPGHGFTPQDYLGIVDHVLPSLLEILPLIKT